MTLLNQTVQVSPSQDKSPGMEKQQHFELEGGNILFLRRRVRNHRLLTQNNKQILDKVNGNTHGKTENQ
jgi:hypothetical protein